MTSRSPSLNPAQADLYRRLQAWSLHASQSHHPAPPLGPGEQAWSPQQTARVVEEYRRFLVLAITMSHPVYPSRAVEQLWHQHRYQSQHYWQEFCPQILGQPLHPIPKRGGEAEQQKHAAWYQQTLESYAKLFAHPAPEDIWPPGIPGSDDHHRSTSHQVWRMPRLRLQLLSRLSSIGCQRRRSSLLLLPTLAGLSLLLTGCGSFQISFPLWPLRGLWLLLVYWVMIAVAMVQIQRLRRWLERPAGPALVSAVPLSLHEVAYLSDGAKQVVQTALLRLIQIEVLEVQSRFGSSAPLIKRQATGLSNPVEQAVVMALSRHHKTTGAALQTVLKQTALFLPLQRRLTDLGLLVPIGRTWMIRLLTSLITIGVSIPLPWIDQVEAVGSDYTFLHGTTITFLFFKLIACLAYLPHRNSNGDDFLDNLKSRVPRYPPASDRATLLNAFALFGVTALPTTIATEFNPLIKAMNQPEGDSF